MPMLFEARDAYMIGQVADLTGLTQRQIRYWDSENVLKPSISSPPDDAPRGGKYRRRYSAADVLALWALASLRARMPFQRVRIVARTLIRMYPDRHLAEILTEHRIGVFMEPGDELKKGMRRQDSYQRVASVVLVDDTEGQRQMVELLSKPGQLRLEVIEPDADLNRLMRELKRGTLDLEAEAEKRFGREAETA